MKTIFALVAAAAMGLASGASAATFQGKFYDTGGRQGGGTPLTDTLTKAEAFLATSPASTATFKSTGVNYGGPSPYLFTDLQSFLGGDASTLNPASAGAINMLGSVITLTGSIRLKAGTNTFDVFSDDGFSMRINGVEEGRFEGLRAPGSSVFTVDGGATGGVVSMELIYFEGSRTQAALITTLNGNTLAAVPLPAGGLLLVGALGGLAVARRRKKAA